MTPRSLTRLIRRAALAAALRILAGVALVGVVVGLVALAGRPESWSGGPRFVAGTALALAGTGTVAALLLGGLAGGVLLRIELLDSGTLSGMRVLGLGPRALLAAGAPVLLLWTALVGGGAFGVEPAAWTAVHRVKGSPAVSAAAVGRLRSGQVVTVPGGALVERQGALEARVGSLSARAERWAPDGPSWSFVGVVADDAESTWEIEHLRLRPAAAATPPRSPWTKTWTGLRRQIAAGEQADRARFVWHRRHALVVLAPLLAVTGFLLGPRRRDGLASATLRTGALAALLLLLVRAADGLPAPLLAGWAPALLGLAGLLVARAWR